MSDNETIAFLLSTRTKIREIQDNLTLHYEDTIGDIHELTRKIDNMIALIKENQNIMLERTYEADKDYQEKRRAF